MPLATIFVTGLVNLVYVGPMATKVMRDRKHLETRDGKKSYDDPSHKHLSFADNPLGSDIGSPEDARTIDTSLKALSIHKPSYALLS